MKRKITCLLSVLLLLLSLTGCRKTLDQVIDTESCFTGTVLEVRKNSLLVEAAEGEDIRHSSDLFDVSLNVEYEDGKSSYHVGDKVTVYYDGSVAESYPAQINTVYAAFLTEPAVRETE